MARSRSASEDSDSDWRACVEYETKAVRVGGTLEVLVHQMEELPVAASLFMLAEMDANETEISGKRLWTGSHFLARVRRPRRSLLSLITASDRVLRGCY
jgi:hypothetical protein